MARRKILKAQDRRELFDIPADEDSLIRHYSLSAADRLEIDLRRREHNKLGFAVQLCVMRRGSGRNGQRRRLTGRSRAGTTRQRQPRT